MSEPVVPRLAVLPNGDAVRPADVLRICIEPAPRLYHADVQRFDVVAHFVDGSTRRLGERLLRAAAKDLAGTVASAVNGVHQRVGCA